MNALFYEIGQHGLDYARKHRNELTSMECMELLLTYPESEEFIPFERMTPNAWFYLIQDAKTLSLTLQDAFPWEMMSKRIRKLIARKLPNIRIPDIKPKAGIDESTVVIQKAPFSPHHTGFSHLYSPPKNWISGCLKIYGLIDGLLLDNYEGNFLTCGCGEPGCSGFWHQSSHLTPSLVHWSIQQYENWYELYFDRRSYEKGAMNLISRLLGAHWNGSESYNYSYSNFAKFRKHAQELLKARPHLAEFLTPGIEGILTDDILTIEESEMLNHNH